jgi:anti-sigma factor (TIGR02949 family)
MDCDGCVDRLYAFLDTELSEAEITSVRSHLEGCQDCDDNFVFEARFLDQLKECVTSDAAPSDLRHRVIEKLRGHIQPPPAR